MVCNPIATVELAPLSVIVIAWPAVNARSFGSSVVFVKTTNCGLLKLLSPVVPETMLEFIDWDVAVMLFDALRNELVTLDANDANVFDID